MTGHGETSVETLAVHAGVGENEFLAVVPPIYQTSTFAFESAEEGAALFAGEKRGYIYSRVGNPTVEVRSVVRPLWQSLGVVPLDATDEALTLHGAKLRLYGLPTTDNPVADAERLASLLAERPPDVDEAVVLLYHMPDLAGRTPGVDLYLAGHTHGGQIRLPVLGPIFTASSAPRRLARGTHRGAGLQPEVALYSYLRFAHDPRR